SIRYIMPYFGGKFKYSAFVFFTKGPGKPLHHNVDPPWNDAMGHQAVLTVFFNGHVPGAGQTIKRICAIAVEVNIMPGAFRCNHISSHIRINGMLRNKIYMRLV